MGGDLSARLACKSFRLINMQPQGHDLHATGTWENKRQIFQSCQIMTEFLSDEEKNPNNSHFVLRDSSSNSVCTANYGKLCTIIQLYLNAVETGSAVNHPPSLFFMQLLESKLETYSCCDRFVLQTLFPRLSGRGRGKWRALKQG